MKSSKQNEECVWIGIGVNVTPDDPGYGEFIQLNKNLVQQDESTFVFDVVSNQPHLNLYDLDVPKDNLVHIESELQQIANSFKFFTVKFGGVNYYSYGIIFVSCEVNDQLEELEKQIVGSTVVYKGDCRTEEYWQPWRKYSQEQIENREKYGNPHVLNTFTPHITIGYVKTNENELQRIVKEIKDKQSIIQLKCEHIDLVVHNKLGELIYSKRFLFKRR